VPTQTFDVEPFTETVLAFPHKRGGSQLILMQYKPGFRPTGVKDPPGKFVFYVEDVKEVLDKCKSFGCEVTLDLGSGKGWVGQIAMVKDYLDGMVLEFMPLSLLKGSADLGVKAKV
jgi:hypothetical protein